MPKGYGAARRAPLTGREAKVAARTAFGLAAHCDHTPWVWSDQYGFRLQFAGIAGGYDRHVGRGTAAAARSSSTSATSS